MNIKKLNESLLIACEKGDLEEVKELVEKGANVNFKFGDIGYGYSGLSDETNLAYFFGMVRFSSKDHLQCLEYLISKGLDINKKVKPYYVGLFGRDLSCEVCTPIQFAVMHHNFFTIEKLLDHNVDLSIKNNKNETALDIAVKCANATGENCAYWTEYSNLVIKMLAEKLYKNSKENNRARKDKQMLSELIKQLENENELIK